MLIRLIALAALILAPIPAFAAPPPPSFTISDATAANGRLCFPIKKHGRINSLPSTVTFYIIAGTAKPPGDYTDPGRVTVSFGAAASTQTECISVVHGAITKTLTGKLIAATNARLYDGTAIGTIPAGEIAPPPSPTSTWALKPLREGATYARAKVDCSSIYRTTETDRVGIAFAGVTAGTVYKLFLGGPTSGQPDSPLASWGWHPFKNIDGQNGDGWALENPAGEPIFVAETCLEGVVPA